MLTFAVVREGCGWGIHVGRSMGTHFRRQDAAIRQAYVLAASIRRHGVPVAVTVDGVVPAQPRAQFAAAAGADLTQPPQRGLAL